MANNRKLLIIKKLDKFWDISFPPCFSYPIGLVDGAWTSWSPWNDCPQNCGLGIVAYVNRTRSCTDPEEAFGGTPCTGPVYQEEMCLNGTVQCYGKKNRSHSLQSNSSPSMGKLSFYCFMFFLS